MVEGWRGTYEEAMSKADSGSLISELEAGYEASYGGLPGPKVFRNS